MSLLIHVSGDDDFSFVLDESVADLWRLQMQRLDDEAKRLSARERVAICMAASMVRCVDGDLTPPSNAQVAYAADISREIAVSIPFEALRHRGAMASFIRRYAPVLQDLRGRTAFIADDDD